MRTVCYIPARLALVVALAFLSYDAMAHGHWVELRAGSYFLYQGHLYSSHPGEARVAYDPAVVSSAKCIERTGGVRDLPLPTSYPARFPAGCAGLWVQTSSGYWSQTFAGTVNKPKTDVSAALRSWLSQESIKRVDAWVPAVASPIGRGLELVPQDNPLTLRRGAKLRLLVAWNGQPKAGVAVAYDSDTRGATDADGKINIRIRHGGTQIISASFEESLRAPEADNVVHATTLQFELPEDKR